MTTTAATAGDSAPREGLSLGEGGDPSAGGRGQRISPACDRGQVSGKSGRDDPGLGRDNGQMTETQAWVIVVELGIVALAYLVGLFRGRAV